MKCTLINYAQFSHKREISNKVLRQQIKAELGISGRRIDNFTLSGLAAVQLLFNQLHPNEQAQLSSNRALISSAQYFSIELLQNLITHLHQGEAIKPLDFVATVGNAANYYIAKQFNINATNLFLGVTENAFFKSSLLALAELAQDPSLQVIVINWQESDEQRVCTACLLGATTEKNPKTINTQILTKTWQPTQITPSELPTTMLISQ